MFAKGTRTRSAGNKCWIFLQFVKDANGRVIVSGRHLSISVEVFDDETGKNSIFYGNDEMVGVDEL
jgi:hypothetical protein